MGSSEWNANGGGTREHRRYPRLECGGTADIRVLPNGGQQIGSVINLSKRGCCFIADNSLRGISGSRIEVHLKVRGIDLRVCGVIRHVHRGVQAGIEFVSLSDRKCEQIDELINELSQIDIQAGLAQQEPPKPNQIEDCGDPCSRPGHAAEQGTVIPFERR